MPARVQASDMTDGRASPPSEWCRLPEMAQQLGLTHSSARNCALVLARHNHAMQTATGRWYVEPAAFAEHAMRTVRKLRDGLQCADDAIDAPHNAHAHYRYR